MITRREFMAAVTQTVAMASLAYSNTPRAQGTHAGSTAGEKNTAEQLAAYAFNLRYEDIDPKTYEVYYQMDFRFSFEDRIDAGFFALRWR